MSDKNTVNILVAQEKNNIGWIRYALILGIIGVCCFLLLKDSMITRKEDYAKTEKELAGEIFKKRRDRFIEERSHIEFKADGKTNMKQIKYKYRLSNGQVHQLIKQAGLSCAYKPCDNNYMDLVGDLVPEKGKELKINYQPVRNDG